MAGSAPGTIAVRIAAPGPQARTETGKNFMASPANAIGLRR